MLRRSGTLLAALVMAAAAVLFSAEDANAQNRLRVNGTVVGIGGRMAGRTRTFSLIVNGFTPTDQVRRLNEALREDGQDGLIRALNRLNAGRISVGPTVGVVANAIIADPWGDGGTKLTVFYERNLNFYELRYGTRSEDYRIGYAEIFLNRNGRGQGTFIPAARVRLRGDNTWEVEDFGVFPARLMGLVSSGRIAR